MKAGEIPKTRNPTQRSDTMPTMTFKVRPTKEAEFEKLMKKFNRCLKASGFAEISPVFIGECDIDIKVGSSNLHYSVKGKEYSLSIPDEIIGMQGYRFIGEYRRLDGKWYRTMQSNDIKDELEVNEKNMRCDHCGKNIKNRNGYFYFRDPENKLVVVGSTCVDAFLGFKVYDLLLALGDATQFERSAGSVDLDKEIIGISIESFYCMVKEATQNFTVWNKTKIESQRQDPKFSTAAKLKDDLNKVFFGKADMVVPTVENVEEQIEKCRHYWNHTFKYDDLSVNSRKIVNGDFVPLQWAGIAGWAVFRSMTDDGKQKPAGSTTAGDFIGEVGAVVTGMLTPRRYFPFANQWGNAWGICFDDNDGNHYLTFTSSSKFVDIIRKMIGKSTKFKYTIAGKDCSRGQNVNKIKSVVTVR